MGAESEARAAVRASHEIGWPVAHVATRYRRRSCLKLSARVVSLPPAEWTTLRARKRPRRRLKAPRTHVVVGVFAPRCTATGMVVLWNAHVCAGTSRCFWYLNAQR